MRWGLEIKDRINRGKTYTRCFLGNEAVDWIAKTLHFQTREDAVDFAQMLVDRSVFHHVNYLETFVDKHALYRFYEVRSRLVMLSFLLLTHSLVDGRDATG